MGPAWAQAFALAGLVTLVGTPLLRKVAVATEFVDSPTAAHKSHKRAIPYLGGIGLIVGVLAGLLFTTDLSPQVRVVALGGPFIGCLGLVDDHRSISALARFLAEILVAAVAVAVGLRIHATDVAVIDTLITVAWIAGVTNALNLLDNMDGLAAGVSAAAAAAIFALAILGEQPVTATMAAGVVGACLGFLAYNKRPASIFMGDTGSLFLGFVLAVSTIDVTPALKPPEGFLIPLMLLALPVLDTTLVTISRIRHGRSISQGGRDHLSHRLVALGLARGGAVAVLVAVEALVGALAVLAGREVLPLWWAVVGVTAVLTGLAFVTTRAEVYQEPLIGLPRRLKLAALCAVAGIAALAAPAAFALVRSQEHGTDGARATREALAALAAGDVARAAAGFDRAAESFRRAQRTLDTPLASLGMVLPGVRANVSAARTAVAVGREAAASASTLASIAEASQLRVSAGSDTLAEARRLAPALSSSAALLQTSGARLGAADRPYLWGSLRSIVRSMEDQMLRQAAATAQAAEVARLVPAMAGEDGTRRYFLAVQDTAELRGTGGVIHLWGELVADHGEVRLSQLGRIDELSQPPPTPAVDLPQAFLDRYREFDPTGTWQNVNVSPDFPTTGRAITSLYARSGRGALDGVIAVDLQGLATILDLVGPVDVDGAGRVTAARLRDLGAGAAGPEPADGVAGLVRATVGSLSQTDMGPAAGLASQLVPAARRAHLLVYSTRPDEQRLVEQLGAAGDIPPVGGDSLLVVNQNLSATGTDRNLTRQMHYEVTLNPSEGLGSAALDGRLEVTLRNAETRSNRTYLSVYSPLSLLGSAVDGRPARVESDQELGRNAYSSMLDIPPAQARTVELDLRGQVGLSNQRWYDLDVLHQPSLHAGNVTASVSVPKGWRIAETRGMRLVGDRRAVAELRVEDRHRLSIRLERTVWSRLWHPADS